MARQLGSQDHKAEGTFSGAKGGGGLVVHKSCINTNNSRRVLDRAGKWGGRVHRRPSSV